MWVPHKSIAKRYRASWGLDDPDILPESRRDLLRRLFDASDVKSGHSVGPGCHHLCRHGPFDSVESLLVTPTDRMYALYRDGYIHKRPYSGLFRLLMNGLRGEDVDASRLHRIVRRVVGRYTDPGLPEGRQRLLVHFYDSYPGPATQKIWRGFLYVARHGPFETTDDFRACTQQDIEALVTNTRSLFNWKEARGTWDALAEIRGVRIRPAARRIAQRAIGRKGTPRAQTALLLDTRGLLQALCDTQGGLREVLSSPRCHVGRVCDVEQLGRTLATEGLQDADRDTLLAHAPRLCDRLLAAAGPAGAGAWFFLARWAVYNDPGLVLRHHVHRICQCVNMASEKRSIAAKPPPPCSESTTVDQSYEGGGGVQVASPRRWRPNGAPIPNPLSYTPTKSASTMWVT